MVETTIIGIDCATDDARVGLSLAVVEADRCVVRFSGTCSSERKVAAVVTEWLPGSTRALLAFDAPLGWPLPMGTALAEHMAGERLSVPADDLFRRATDRFVRQQLRKQSLDVGADRIARTAHSALKLLDDVRQGAGLPIPMAWEPSYSERVTAIEVYPAATLIAHGIPTAGYKKRQKIEARGDIMVRLDRILQLPEDKALLERSADALDSVVCVLAGFDFLRGEAYTPQQKAQLELAKKEGWIWVRQKSPRG